MNSYRQQYFHNLKIPCQNSQQRGHFIWAVYIHLWLSFLLILSVPPAEKKEIKRLDLYKGRGPMGQSAYLKSSCLEQSTTSMDFCYYYVILVITLETQNTKLFLYKPL